MENAFTNHLYRGDEDRSGMLSIVRARAPRRKLDYPNLTDLQELLGTSRVRQAARLPAARTRAQHRPSEHQQ